MHPESLFLAEKGHLQRDVIESAEVTRPIDMEGPAFERERYEEVEAKVASRRAFGSLRESEGE